MLLEKDYKPLEWNKLPGKESSLDKWMLSRLSETIEVVNKVRGNGPELRGVCLSCLSS
jgi:hypothetical protein